jgi:hypothetical protein
MNNQDLRLQATGYSIDHLNDATEKMLSDPQETASLTKPQGNSTRLSRR